VEHPGDIFCRRTERGAFFTRVSGFIFHTLFLPERRPLMLCYHMAREIKRPRNAQGRVTQVALRRTWHASILPRLGAHTPFSKSPQYRSCIASNSGQGHVP
jgi:hypothetical protein